MVKSTNLCLTDRFVVLIFISHRDDSGVHWSMEDVLAEHLDCLDFSRERKPSEVSFPALQILPSRHPEAVKQ